MTYRMIIFLLSVTVGVYGQGRMGLAMVAQNLKTGEQISEGNINQQYVPASVLKVVTCAMAWDKLGEDFRFRSEVHVSGQVDANGIVQGDLIIQSSGDPTWDSRHLSKKGTVVRDIYDILCERGIHGFSGDLMIETATGATDHVSRYWLWEDLGNYYASGSWPINWRDNSIHIQFTRNQDNWDMVGSSADGIHNTWVNEVELGPAGSGDQAYVFGSPYQDRRYIRGTLPRDRSKMTIKASMPNPVNTFAGHLIRYLNQNGIEIGTEVKVHLQSTRSNQKVTRVIGEIRSPEFDWIIRNALLHSDNLYVEAIAKRSFANASNYDEFLRSANAYLKEEWPERPVILKDACGLSPLNRIAPLDLLSIWKDIIRSHPEFVELMPQYEGVSLGRMLNQQGVMKSGSMDGVLCYLGYDSNDWIYAVMYNGSESSSVIRKSMANFINSISK